jgi:hypothetical protein
MNFKVTVNHKLIVNGKEYGSPDEMPEELRRAYERAMGNGQGAAGLIQRASKIVFQGNEYGTPADMPADVRKLYELAIAAAKLEKPHPTDAGAISGAKPTSIVERNSVFVPASHIETSVPAVDQTRSFSIELRVGKNGLLLVLAVLLFIFWYALSGPSK